MTRIHTAAVSIDIDKKYQISYTHSTVCLSRNYIKLIRPHVSWETAGGLNERNNQAQKIWNKETSLLPHRRYGQAGSP